MQPRGYAKDSTSRGPRFEPCENFLFVYSLFLFFFFHLLFLVWKFDVLFVGVLVVLFLMVTVNRRGRYYCMACNL